jgi:sodium-dependent dicarboxylate transporter 2/3/5
VSDATPPPPPDTTRQRVRRTGRVAGPLLAALAFATLPESYDHAGETLAFSAAGRGTAAIAVWMAVWWLSEAIPIYATALLPLALLPLIGAGSMREAAAPYGHELIFLFMGGFLLALAMERWGLHRRMALTALRIVGERPIAMVGGFMATTAGLSMWVSNTATAVMMLPVAVSVIDLVARQLGTSDATSRDPQVRHFGLCLMLGIAYAASIGGLATPIGTPPNLFLLSFVSEELGHDISFVRWMGVGLPLTLVFLPIAWGLLTRVLYPIELPRIQGASQLVRRELATLGPISRAERITLAAFASASFLWVARPLLAAIEIAGVAPFAGLTDAGIAMLAALSLFVARADRECAVLDWETAVKLPWGVLVLFGGGLSLAAAIGRHGVGEFLGAQVGGLAGAPALAIVLCVTAGVIFLTELTSNTATTATLVPILASLAPGLGLPPLLLAVPATLAASCAFMLPVATPPNAVIFASGHVTIAEMSRAGLWVNGVGVALIPLVTYALALPLLH